MFNPNASVPLMYCEMLPGNIAVKNAAVIQPIFSLCLIKSISERPRSISTTPDAITTKSAWLAKIVGTCA